MSSKKNYNRPLGAEEEKRVIKNGSILFVSSLIFMGALTALVHFDAIKLYPSSMNTEMVKGYAGRIEYTFRYQTLLAIWLMFNILATIQVRLSNMAINPLDEKSEQRVHMVKNILTNSFEQIVLSVLAQLIFVSFAAPECILKVIPLVNVIQFVGRIAFFAGYPFKRSFGFTCTMLPTMALVVYDAYKFVSFLGLY